MPPASGGAGALRRRRAAALFLLLKLWAGGAQDVVPPRVDVAVTDSSRTTEVALAVSNPTDEELPFRFQVQYAALAAGPIPGAARVRSYSVAPAAPAPANSTAEPPCAGVHRLLVKLRGDSAGVAGPASRMMGDTTLGVQSWLELPRLGLHIAELGCEPGGRAPGEILDSLKELYRDGIEFAELDGELEPAGGAGRDLQNASAASPPLQGGPDDPLWGEQWGMARTRLQAAWDRLQAAGLAPSETVVAVLDTGLNLDHEDLKDSIWTNPGEIPDNGIDDDNNGFVDDVHGWNFDGRDNNVSDTDGPGTSCAGIIAAAANNSKGIAGVAGWNANVKIMGIKVASGQRAASRSTLAEGLDYALSFGVPISSSSFGGKRPDGGHIGADLSIRDMLARATAAGHLFVVAAMNAAEPADDWHPCAEDEALCVAATTQNETLAGFSNYGMRVHVAAPGSEIYTTSIPGDAYTSVSGTSFAAPLVAGAAALVRSNFPYLSPLQIKQGVLATAAKVDWLQDKVTSSAILDVASLIELADKSLWVKLGTDPTAHQNVNVVAPPKTSFKLAVRVGGFVGLPNGVSAAEILVSTPRGMVSVPVTLQKSPGSPLLAANWTRKPFVLNLGTYTVGQPSGGVALHFRNAGQRTLHVRSSSPLVPFSILGRNPTEVPPNASGSILYNCLPTRAGEHVAGVTLHTDSGVDSSEGMAPSSAWSGTQYRFNLSCTSVRHSTKPFFTLALDLGSAEVGRATRSVPVPFRNTGYGSLHVQSGNVSAPFGIDGRSSVEVPSGASGSISYRCTPTQIGEQVSIVKLHTNSGVNAAQGGGEYRVELRCVGWRAAWRKDTLQAAPGTQAAALGVGAMALASLWQWRRRVSAAQQGMPWLSTSLAPSGVGIE